MDAQRRENGKGEFMSPGVSVDRRGGMKAAVFVLGLLAFEIMAIAAVGNNLITYVFNEMHFPLSKSANLVTNFVGTVFLLSLLGGFLADSYLGSFPTMLASAFVELSGFVLLSVQAYLPQLRPPRCDMTAGGSHRCAEAEGWEATTLYLSLFLVALGSGCLKPNMVSHGADQFGGGDDEPSRSRKLSTYFNAAYFCFCVGELAALTALVWVQTRSGMAVGFASSAAAMAAGLLSLVSGVSFYRNKPPPKQGASAGAITRRKQICPSGTETLGFNPNPKKKLSTAAAARAEQVRIVLRIAPIFASTIIFNTILAQLQTFSVQQGSLMNAQLTRTFTVPPASLQSIPYLMLIFLVPLYELAFVPLTRRITSTASGISPLQRVGAGLLLATFSMVSAALVEKKRRDLATGSAGRLPILWIAPQFLVFGLSEMFTAVGLIEFFYKQDSSMGGGMQASLTAMTYCSYSFGFYLSSLLVTLVNKVTSAGEEGKKKGWLEDNDLNKDRLDLFYWLLAALSLLNFFNYLFWSRRYADNTNTSLPTADIINTASGSNDGEPNRSPCSSNDTAIV